ncbi:MAG: PAS domain-containing protein [Synechococcaceae cyanobacterium SM1_2_3]|nr:PAS domain-containing protein [Synechococcaceae cyanobacterium SM1_2_3]
MPKPSDQDDSDSWESQRDRIIGLGERSFRKSYYPQLRRNLSQLERFRALLDFAGEMVLLVSVPDGVIVDANAASAETLGQPSETLIGQRLAQLGFEPRHRNYRYAETGRRQWLDPGSTDRRCRALRCGSAAD